MSEGPQEVSPARSWLSRQARASLSLSFIVLLSAATLEYSNFYRHDRYPVGVGVAIPSWSGNHPDTSKDFLEVNASDCRTEPTSDVHCALFRAFGSREQGANEVAVIDRATARDRSTDYCDRFYGACATQPANVTIRDASDIFSYLELVYMGPARENIRRGRVAKAYAAISRVGYLTGPIDLPLGSEGCCSYSDAHYLFPAFLSEKSRWRDRWYVLSVLDLTGGDETSETDSAYEDVNAYARGIEAATRRCFRAAAFEFQQLAEDDERRRVKELAAYMALLSRFRDRFYGEENCEAEQPPELGAGDVAHLKSFISRRSYLTDLSQMDSALAKKRAAT